MVQQLVATRNCGADLDEATIDAGKACRLMDERPNLLLITTHDLGRWLNCYGVSTVQSPHLDALAGDGIRFSGAFCSAPQCSPSRASLFTGRYPHSNGVMGLVGSNYAFDLHPEERHLGQVLQAHGYTTALIGVHHECAADSPARIRKRCGMETLVPDFPKGKAASAASLAAEALKLLAHYADGDQPFYLQLGFYEPHRQPSRTRHEQDYVGFLGDYVSPDDSQGVTVPGYLRDTPLAREEIAELQGAVHYLDAALGQILSSLRRLGLEENTLVLFTADHGAGLPRAKLTLYDPGIEIPLIIRLPARGWQGGRVQAELVSNVDVFPTLLDLVGIEVDTTVQGKSLVPLMDGHYYEPADAVFAEKTYHGYYDPMRCIRTERYKLVVNLTAGRMHQNCTQSWRPRSDPIVPLDLTDVTYAHPLVELYDLTDDPWELRNLAAESGQKQILEILLARLCDWMKKTADPLLLGPIRSPMHDKAIETLNTSLHVHQTTGRTS